MQDFCRFVPEDPDVREGLEWAAEVFPDAPGDPREFAWPTTDEEATEALHDFTAHRLRASGPYEDAVSSVHPYLNHALLTSSLNTGLLNPAEVVTAVLAPPRTGRSRSPPSRSCGTTRTPTTVAVCWSGPRRG